MSSNKLCDYNIYLNYETLDLHCSDNEMNYDVMHNRVVHDSALQCTNLLLFPCQLAHWIEDKFIPLFTVNIV